MWSWIWEIVIAQLLCTTIRQRMARDRGSNWQPCEKGAVCFKWQLQIPLHCPYAFCSFKILQIFYLTFSRFFSILHFVMISQMKSLLWMNYAFILKMAKNFFMKLQKEYFLKNLFEICSTGKQREIFSTILGHLREELRGGRWKIGPSWQSDFSNFFSHL